MPPDPPSYLKSTIMIQSDFSLDPPLEYDTVARGKAKTKLIEQGLYVDAWPFQKSYNERELKAEMSSLFNKHLVNKDGKEVR